MNTPPIPKGSQSQFWFYADAQGESRGPISSEELKRLVATGIVTPEMLVSPEGQNIWKPVSEVWELSDLNLKCAAPFHSSTPPPAHSGIQMETPLMEAEGDGGTLQLFEDKVCIRRKPGFVSFFTYGAKGDKDIYIAQISSVQFKAAGLLTGYIQFTFPGGKEANHGHYEAFSDENTVMFRAEQQWKFQRIKEEIDKRIAARTSGHLQPNHPSYLDELERLASLRDKGIVTPEEFEAKKRNLLGI